MRATFSVPLLLAFRVTAVQLQGWALTPADAEALIQVSLVNGTAGDEELDHGTAGDAAAPARSGKGCCCYVRSRCSKTADCVALREEGNDGCPTATLQPNGFIKAATCYQRMMGYGPIGLAVEDVQKSHPAYQVADFCKDPALYDRINGLAGVVFEKFGKGGHLPKEKLDEAFDHILRELRETYEVTVTKEDLLKGHGYAITRHDLVLLLMDAVNSLPSQSAGDTENSIKGNSDLPAKNNIGGGSGLPAGGSVGGGSDLPAKISIEGKSDPSLGSSDKTSITKGEKHPTFDEINRFNDEELRRENYEAALKRYGPLSARQKQQVQNLHDGKSANDGLLPLADKKKSKARAAEKPGKHFFGLRDLPRRILRAMKNSQA